MTNIKIDDEIVREAIELIGDDFGPQDLALILQQRDNATRELEAIAAFDEGRAGDDACRFLIDAGVWTSRIQRLDGKPLAFPPHIPHRGSDVETYIKSTRDKYGTEMAIKNHAWIALDRLLDDYRLHADTGTPLDQETSDGGDPENQGARS